MTKEAHNKARAMLQSLFAAYEGYILRVYHTNELPEEGALTQLADKRIELFELGDDADPIAAATHLYRQILLTERDCGVPFDHGGLRQRLDPDFHDAFVCIELA